MTDKSAIIVKPSTAQAFETLWKRGRVLFFSAPCGFGKTVLADTLLDGRPVLRMNAADTGFALPSLEDAWDILLIDNIQDMQEERDWQALRALIRESTGQHWHWRRNTASSAPSAFTARRCCRCWTRWNGWETRNGTNG